MTDTEFDRRVRVLGLKSKAIPIARQVLVHGASIMDAVRDHGDCSYAVAWRVVDRIEMTLLCPCCGEELDPDHPDAWRVAAVMALLELEDNGETPSLAAIARRSGVPYHRLRKIGMAALKHEARIEREAS